MSAIFGNQRTSGLRPTSYNVPIWYIPNNVIQTIPAVSTGCVLSKGIIQLIDFINKNNYSDTSITNETKLQVDTNTLRHIIKKMEKEAKYDQSQLNSAFWYPFLYNVSIETINKLKESIKKIGSLSEAGDNIVNKYLNMYTDDYVYNFVDETDKDDYKMYLEILLCSLYSKWKINSTKYFNDLNELSLILQKYSKSWYVNSSDMWGLRCALEEIFLKNNDERKPTTELLEKYKKKYVINDKFIQGELEKKKREECEKKELEMKNKEEEYKKHTFELQQKELEMKNKEEEYKKHTFELQQKELEIKKREEEYKKNITVCEKKEREIKKKLEDETKLRRDRDIYRQKGLANEDGDADSTKRKKYDKGDEEKYKKYMKVLLNPRATKPQLMDLCVKLKLTKNFSKNKDYYYNLLSQYLGK